MGHPYGSFLRKNFFTILYQNMKIVSRKPVNIQTESHAISPVNFDQSCLSIADFVFIPSKK